MLTFRKSENIEVIGYSDSDFSGCVDGKKFTSCYIFILAGGPISSKSAKQSITAPSTMQEEFMACYEGTGQAVWLKNFIPGLQVIDSIIRPLTFVIMRLLFSSLKIINQAVLLNGLTSNILLLETKSKMVSLSYNTLIQELC
jgi:hypothetical protein